MRAHNVFNTEPILQVLIERCRQLVEDLTRLHSEYLPDAERRGVLRRAAEFMVSQRGLHAQKGETCYLPEKL
jgi:hypothetical protein